MAVITNAFLNLFGPMWASKFKELCGRPKTVQEELLRRIVKENSDTTFGRKHGFRRFRTFKSWRTHVPITTYDDIASLVEQEMCGKHGQLTAEKPILFTRTSGTTGASKFIPVTKSSRQANSERMRMWISAFYRDHPAILAGKVLTVVSPEEESLSPCGIPCGSESGHAYRNAPGPIRMLYALPYEVFKIENYDARYYAILRLAAAQPISLIVTANPSTIQLLCERLAAHGDEIAKDVENGSLSERFEIPKDIRGVVTKGLTPDPERAKALRASMKDNSGKLTPKGIWPEIGGIGCWTGGTVGGYLDRLRPSFPDHLPIRDIGYLASEVAASIPIHDETSLGVLAIGTNVYEFYPADLKRPATGAALITASDLEINKRYFVYVTTSGGLYRYDMNDIVEVGAFYGKTPMVRFIQKGKGIVSFTGEKLTETQVLTAATNAFKELGDSCQFITAVGVMEKDKLPQYIFLAEMSKCPPLMKLRALADDLEKELAEQNYEYEGKRKSRRIAPLALRIVKRGQFDKYRKRKSDEGRVEGQFKILRLTDDVSLLEEFATTREVTAHDR